MFSTAVEVPVEYFLPVEFPLEYVLPVESPVEDCEFHWNSTGISDSSGNPVDSTGIPLEFQRFFLWGSI